MIAHTAFMMPASATTVTIGAATLVVELILLARRVRRAGVGGTGRSIA
ncbi:hypothetical protein [Kribbella sp. DT2]